MSPYVGVETQSHGPKVNAIPGPYFGFAFLNFHAIRHHSPAMIRFIFTIAIIAGLAALVTKPSEQRVEQILHDKIRDAIQDRALNTEGGAASVAATALCKLDPNACADLILSGAKIEYENKYVFATVDVKGFGREASCFGAFTTLLCPGGDPTR